MLHIIKTVFYILCIFVLLQHKAVFFRNDLNNRLSLLFRAGAGAGAGPAPPIGATAQSFLTPSESQGSLGGWTSPARRCLVSMPLYATYSSTYYRLISFGSLMMRGRMTILQRDAARLGFITQRRRRLHWFFFLVFFGSKQERSAPFVSIWIRHYV